MKEGRGGRRNRNRSEGFGGDRRGCGMNRSECIRYMFENIAMKYSIYNMC